MKVLFIGCTEFSDLSLRHMFAIGGVEVVGIVTKKKSTFNANFKGLGPLAKQHHIPCFYWSGDCQSELLSWAQSLRPDVIYCFGWSHLLSGDLIKVPRLGSVGYHPAPLPKFRGRHPVIWTLVLGLTETASTFFLMNEGIDAGDILSQKFVQVSEQDDARSLLNKLYQQAIDQMTVFTRQLMANDFVPVVQSVHESTSWRKRSEMDGQIDWRMSARSIYNLIRALAKPYPGACFLRKNEKVKVWKAAMGFSKQIGVEPGKVLHVDEGKFEVKCGEGSILIEKHDFKSLPAVGAYL